MSQFLYHFKPKSLHGDILFPLNDLKSDLPSIYAEQAKKYEGREHLLQERIPLLDCLWNDVLHFSPINPQIILNTWNREGLRKTAGPASSIEVIKVPPLDRLMP